MQHASIHHNQVVQNWMLFSLFVPTNVPIFSFVPTNISDQSPIIFSPNHIPNQKHSAVCMGGEENHQTKFCMPCGSTIMKLHPSPETTAVATCRKDTVAQFISLCVLGGYLCSCKKHTSPQAIHTTMEDAFTQEAHTAVLPNAEGNNTFCFSSSFKMLECFQQPLPPQWL